MAKYWFKRRRFGWGWVPVTWQGWAVLAGYLLVVVGASLMLQDAPEDQFSTELGVYFLILILATTGLLSLSLRKGPKPRWRWGRRDGDNPDEDF